jgi:non-specific serine/threonine protein kinase
MFGRFQLLRLLGKSTQSMLWLVQDGRTDAEGLLALPRTQILDERAMSSWQQRARRATRLTHPHLADVVEVGDHDHWPYVVYERGEFVTWSERVTSKGVPPTEIAEWSVQVLRGLAFAHEAGMAHRDLQMFSLLVDDAGHVKVLGLEVAEFMPFGAVSAADGDAGGDAQGGQAAMDERRQQRHAATYDVLAYGLVVHQVLAGQPALEEPDIARVIARMPPHGTDIVRLPWQVPRPIPEPMRAIVNRATDRQERQRYRSARTFERALEGWLRASSDPNAGPITLLLDRLRSVGVMPAMPGGADRAARLALMETGHTNELSDIVLQDLGLAFELLRAVNLAQAQAGHAINGPILATHRAVAMLGLDGVRRSALSLRGWPGPLDAAGASALEALIARVKRAANIARALQPAGYDTEVVYLITALQNLGSLVVQYHFPEEAQQVRRLMQPAAAAKSDQPDEPGMSAEAAAFAVLGVDIESLGSAVLKHWGLDESVQHLVRRLPLTGAVRAPESDDELLRTIASCSNEVVDALGLPARHVMVALQRVVQRYGRILNITLKDLHEVLQAQGGVPAIDPAPTAAPRDATATAAAAPGAARARPKGDTSGVTVTTSAVQDRE